MGSNELFHCNPVARSAYVASPSPSSGKPGKDKEEEKSAFVGEGEEKTNKMPDDRSKDRKKREPFSKEKAPETQPETEHATSAQKKPKEMKKRKKRRIRITSVDQSASVAEDRTTHEKEDFATLEKKLREFDFYHGFLPREDLASTIQNPGEFLLRVSEVVEAENKVNREVILSLIPVQVDGKEEEDKKKVRNVVIKRVAANMFFCEPTRTFESINELIVYYQKNTGVCSSGQFQLKTAVLIQPWEFMHSDVTIGKVLGEGAFGKVCSGTLKLKDGQQVEVAIKMTKVSAFLSKMKIKEMMNEARFIRNFNNKNVVRLYGVAHDEQPLYILLELVKGGSLLDYLKKNSKAITLTERLKFCLGAARGIEYLHQNNCIHRDIAARNCLLSENVVKITDFGLSRTGPSYKMKTSCKLPVKWLAPETITTLSFSFATDVYSWGITVYEVFADGAEPFPEIPNAQVKVDVPAGKFLQLPSHTPDAVKKYIGSLVFTEGPRRATMTDAAVEFERFVAMSETGGLDAHGAKLKILKVFNKKNTPVSIKKMVHLNKAIQEGDNPDLTEERLTGTFDTNAMAAQIHGGERRARRRREITAAVAKLPELHDSKPLPFMTREEKVLEGARKVSLLTQKIKDIVDPTNGAELYHLNNEVVGIEGNPMALHGIMFIPALTAQASAEQQAKWLTRAQRREIIGTYAQTELGHGTNLQNLETTATYDTATQEFVLHTPQITALKWWPGNLGKSSNYAIVVAHMIIKDKNYGPQTFMVQLRDEQTHKPLPGITIGDIGPKMAYNITDNGFLGFDHFRIPRTNLLMRHSRVEPDGTFVKPPHAKINYSAMVHVRSYMITGQAMMLAYALTIATRYSSVRRQGQINKTQPEVKVLEYQTQQHRLFPAIARAYAFMFAGAETVKLYERVTEQVSTGNVSLLADLHALTSGLKSVVSWQTGEGIEQARMACGGHGYSQASYLSEIYGVAIGGCTYEGENMVMLLQLARYLVKSAALVKAGQSEKLGPLVAYLGVKSEATSLIDRTPNGGFVEYVKTFQHIAKRQTFKAAEKFFGLIEKGEKREIAWNKSSVELNRASRLHTRLFIVEAFMRRVLEVAEPRLKEVLTDLLRLHVNYELLDVATYALEDGFLSASQLDYVREQLYFYLAKIRPNAVSLVDSWEFSDIELRSVLGRRDGHVYKNLFEWAKSSPLNETDVLPSVEKYLKPMMDSARQSKL
ncbi:unnamed protein product [Caenorhabditis sp. 36 PRJEB53466]|nr:unnamed protein product [Caenorhabditis sp. 36 PRJEB53466]